MEGTTTDQHSFTDNGINNIDLGVELFKGLNMDPAEFSNPTNNSMVREIAEFMENHPEPTGIISSVLSKKTNPSVRNLDHLYNYVQLSKKRESLRSEMDKLTSELKYYE